MVKLLIKDCKVSVCSPQWMERWSLLLLNDMLTFITGCCNKSLSNVFKVTQGGYLSVIKKGFC